MVYCKTYIVYYILLYLLYILRYNLLLTHIVHHTCYMSTFRLYKTVIMFLMHFVRNVFNLPHLYTSIDLSKSLNTTPVNTYYYETNGSINPLTTYNYFEIPAVTIIVVPAILIPLNDFPFYDMTNEFLPAELSTHISSDTEKKWSPPLNLIHDFDYIDYSTLGNIDPDTNFLSNINTSLCKYYTELEFNQQFPQDYKLSMFNLNVRSLPKILIKLNIF